MLHGAENELSFENIGLHNSHHQRLSNSAMYIPGLELLMHVVYFCWFPAFLGFIYSLVIMALGKVGLTDFTFFFKYNLYLHILYTIYFEHKPIKFRNMILIVLKYNLCGLNLSRGARSYRFYKSSQDIMSSLPPFSFFQSFFVFFNTEKYIGSWGL